MGLTGINSEGVLWNNARLTLLVERDNEAPLGFTIGKVNSDGSIDLGHGENGEIALRLFRDSSKAVLRGLTVHADGYVEPVKTIEDGGNLYWEVKVGGVTKKILLQ